MSKTTNEKLVLQGGASFPSLPSKSSLGTDASGNVITGSASGASYGSSLLDFGAFPGKSDASLAVTGQTGIVAGSILEAWVFPASTSDHSADEHIAESLEVAAGNIATGTGFTLYGRNALPGKGRIYGKWNIGWMWR